MDCLDENCRREIEELHDFFCAWFTGTLPESSATFARFESVLDPEFELVTPDGEARGRAELLSGLRALHESRDAGFRIWIQGFRSSAIAEGIQLATYEEWQETAEGRSSRISSAVFRARADCPNGVEWVRVHEIWRRGSR